MFELEQQIELIRIVHHTAGDDHFELRTNSLTVHGETCKWGVFFAVQIWYVFCEDDLVSFTTYDKTVREFVNRIFLGSERDWHTPEALAIAEKYGVVFP